MIRGRRTIRWLKWAGVGLCVLVAATWAVSMFAVVSVDAEPRFTVSIESGVFIFVFDRPGPRFSFGRSWSETVVFIPLWMPLALLAVPTALLFWAGPPQAASGVLCVRV